MHAQFWGNEMNPSGSEKEVKLVDFTLVKRKFFVKYLLSSLSARTLSLSTENHNMLSFIET